MQRFWHINHYNTKSMPQKSKNSSGVDSTVSKIIKGSYISLMKSWKDFLTKYESGY